MNIVSPTTLAPQKISPVADPALLPKPDLYRQLRLLLAGIVVPMLVLTLAIVIGVSRVTEERTGEGILQTARGVMASTDAELKGYIGAARLLSGSPALQAGDLAAFQLEANRFVATFPGRGSNVVLSDREGNILLSVLPLKGPLKRANLAGVDQVFTDKGTYVSDMYLGAVTGLPTFTIDMPVVKDGEVLYALAFNPPRDAFFDIVDTLNLPDGWVISIFDRNNHHVARNPPLVDRTDEKALTSAASSLQAEMRKGPEGIASTVSVEGVRLLTAYTRSPETGWTVAIGVPAEELEASVNRALVLTVAFSALFYLIAAAFAFRMARTVTRAETQRELLINELNHRVKNTLAGVQAIVTQTLRRTVDPAQVRTAIQNRLMAMSRAHNVLSDRNWTAVELGELIRVILQAYEDAALARVRMTGPPLTLSPRQAVPLAMIVNELATNALKYGALSIPSGGLAVSWRRADTDLHFTWEEQGAPLAGPPAATGFGTFFIERAVVHELHGEVVRDYAQGGLKVRIQFPLEAVQAS